MPVKQFVMSPAGVHEVDELCGWAGKPGGRPELVKEAFDLWSANTPRSAIKSLPYTAGSRSMLWEVGRRILGTDPLNYAQAIGDCVSFAGKNTIEYMQFYPIVNGNRFKWTRVFPPYLYGCGRIFIGNGQMGNQDGSVAAWQAQAVQKYGTISIDAPNCPAYSGDVAKQWGYDGPPQKFVPVGQEHLVRTTAAVATWEDVTAALTNGYPCSVASNVGFDMVARSDGFHHYSTHWGHNLTIIGVDDDPGDPYACILNSWGPNIHGIIKDFKTGEQWPGGTLRVRKADVLSILAEQDSWAYSSFDGFPAQEIPESAFDLW